MTRRRFFSTLAGTTAVGLLAPGCSMAGPKAPPKLPGADRWRLMTEFHDYTQVRLWHVTPKAMSEILAYLHDERRFVNRLELEGYSGYYAIEGPWGKPILANPDLERTSISQTVELQ